MKFFEKTDSQLHTLIESVPNGIIMVDIEGKIVLCNSETEKMFKYQVQQKNEEMEQFVYTVSHDLKAPLVTSTSFIGFLREDIAKKNYNEVPDSLDRLEKAHKRMQELISDLLQLSHVGRMDLNIEEIQLSPLLNEIIESNSECLKEKKVKIILAGEDLSVRADRKRISQVFDNLINNAVKYASDVPNPKIQIFFKDLPDEVQVCVKDGVEAMNWIS